MLKILLGTDQNALSDEILRRVCQASSEEIRGQILIVPEQYSHEMERALCTAGGDSICLSAEVLSFTRLAGRVSSLYGGVSRKTLDQGGRLIAMSMALEIVGSRLKLYGASRKKPEFLLRMLSVLDELKSARVGAEQLQETARQAGGQLAVKLEELALIQESLETVCASMGQDANDRLSLLADQLSQHPYAEGRRIYLLGFSDFTGQELEVLGELLGGGGELTAAVLSDGSDHGAFSMGAATGKRLRQLAAQWNQTCTTERVEVGPDRPPELLHLCSHLFAGAPTPWESAADHLRLHHSASIHGACMDVAGQIQKLAQSGWRYRDMAVCCTDPDAYRPVLESVFERFSIPLYVSGADNLESDPVTGMVCAALDAATGGMNGEDVLRFLKSGLSPLEPEVCDLLENYVRTWKIRGRKWETDWDMHPDGYGLPVDERTAARLATLNQARIQGAGPLLALRDGLRSAADTGAQVLALYDFLERIDLAGTLERLQARCETEAQLRQAQAYGQMYEILSQALEQMFQVLGRTVRQPEDFSGMFAAVLSQYTVGTIPANLDSVQCGGIPAMRFCRCRALFLVGAEDGLFPDYQTETSLLTEQDRRRLLELGVGIAPGRSDQMDRELTAIHQVLSAPSDLLSVGYVGDQPSFLFTRMRQLFPCTSPEEDAVLPEILCYDADALGEAVAGSGQAGLPAAVQAAAERTVRRAAYRIGALEPTEVTQLYGKKLYLSASRIDQYAACRCAYFLRYGLRLKPQKEAAFDAPVYGTFVHAVLERTAAQVRREGGFHQVSEERLLEIAREMIDSYEDETLSRMLQRSERLTYLFRRNQEEVLEVVRELGRELRVSDFEPAGFEVEFSMGGQMDPVEIHGEHAQAELSGFVDRVDLYTNHGVTYVRVVDYKTGKKAFDYTDVLNGMGLQMLIYLFALEENGAKAFGGKLQPAGVLYFPARRPVLSATGRLSDEEAEKKRRSEQTRQGLLSRDETVLGAMEHYERTPVYMPYQVNAKGELTGDLADGEEMRRLKHHVQRVLAQMADDIASGQVEPNPITRGPDEGSCTWCDYAEVCHQASGEVAARPMKKSSRKEFWERLKREEGDHG